MNIHHYHPATGEFITSGQADPSPLEPDAWLVPDGATSIAPPALSMDKARVFADGTWSLVDDHRGETWWNEDGQPVVVTALGDPAALGLSVAEPPPTLAKQKADLIAAITVKRDAMITAGAPVSGLHVAIDTDGRGDMGGMATTALAAASSVVPWPESYQLGWITIENTRIPLPTPADGLALAATVGDWYARIVQNARDLKDLVLGADDDLLPLIDIEGGWPI